MLMGVPSTEITDGTRPMTGPRKSDRVWVCMNSTSKRAASPTNRAALALTLRL